MPNSTGVLFPASAHVATPIDSSYALVFDEEFNGTSVNTNVWNVANNNTFGTDTNAVAGNNTVQNGFLRQQVTNVASGGKTWSGASIFQFNNIGPVNGFLFGYFETRCKFPGPNTPILTAVGAIPAVWMNNLGGFPETDIIEMNGGLGGVDNDAYTNPDLTGGFGFFSPYRTTPDPSAAFHVYGMLWTAAAVTFYVDGVQSWLLVDGNIYNVNGTNFTWSVNKTVPQYMNIWNLISIASAGAPNAQSVFPYNFYVDYLHIYQQGGIPVTPQPNYGGPGDALGSGHDPGF